jgi:SAM-dependent methyltransferase
VGGPVNPLSEKGYWDGLWERRGVKGHLDFRNYSLRRFDAFFRRVLPGTPGLAFLEIGCAGSRWLRYFAEVFGYRVSGIDYSELGCRQAREILRQFGVAGEIFCRDVFAESPDLEGGFDVVFSYGFVEHFGDPVSVLRRMARFCRPHGHILTVIPNLLGIPGILQWWADRPVYDLHRPMDPEEMAAFHRAAGFRPIAAVFLGSVASGTLVFPRHPWTWRVVRKTLKLFTKGLWKVFDVTGWHPETRVLSPYVVFAGQRDGEGWPHHPSAPRLEPRIQSPVRWEDMA